MRKIHRFQEDVRREASAELMDVSRLETLLDEFTAPPDVDIPELTLLRKVSNCLCAMQLINALISEITS